MSDIKFSKEQLKAIELRNSSLMVSAAAGSGKTAVLVERIIRKITEDTIDVDKMLIVTFTNAAAQGMKRKIKAAIKECIKKDPGNANLKKQLLLVDKANISTVHSFCLDLIKKYSHMLSKEVPKDFSLINETEKSLMMNQILTEIISDCYEKNEEDFIKLLDCFGQNSSDSKITSLIIMIYNFLVSIPDYRKWVYKNLDLISGKSEFYKSNYAYSLEEYLKNVMKSSYDKYSYAISYIENNQDMAGYYDLLKEERLYFEKALKISDLKELISHIGKIEFTKLPSTKKSIYTELCQEVRNSVKKAVGKINEHYSNEIIEINLKNSKEYGIINKLFEIVLLFDEKFKEEKYQSGYLDFNDLEHLTISLLSVDGKLKEEFWHLRDSFEEILVDEYQDTNDVQEAIFTLLKKENNLFTVGDIKQSIYRFRHANPDLFLERMDDYNQCKTGEVVNLNANYRCHQNIVDAVNMIFSFIMSKELSGIDYKSAKLIAKGDFSDVDKLKMSCDVKIALTDKSDEDEDFEKEAKIIADSINKLIEDKDIKIKGRSLKYSDITILLRSFNEKSFGLLKELSKYNIPVSYEDKTQFFDTAEIKSFISLLKIIDNPYDDISYIAALRNIFLYSDDDLLRLRLLSKKAPFYELHKKSEDKKDKKVISYIEFLRDFSKKYDLKTLITKIYEDTFYVEYQTGYIGGHKRKENLERLIDIASTFEENEYKGLYSFINYIDKIVSGKTKIANPKIDDSKDTVKVMSIHSSKGLEFPVVILSGMNKQFNKLDFNSDIVLSSKLGIGYTYVDYEGQFKYPSIYKNIICEEELKELLLEEERILYVALTRAQYKLIMTGCVKKPSKAEWFTKFLNVGVMNGDTVTYTDFKSMNSYFDMTLPSLLKEKNKNDDGIYTDGEWLSLNDGMIKIYVYDDLSLKTKEEEYNYSIKDMKISKEQKELMDEKYLYTYSSCFKNIPKKISVTEARKMLQDDDTDYDFNPADSIYVPDFRKEASISARERGTLIHYVFENIDLDLLRNTDNKMKVILDFISQNNYIKDKLTHYDLKKAEAFFDSYIGIKMLRAKTVEREKEFLVKIPANEIYKDLGDKSTDMIIVQGIIDCFFVDNKGDIYLVDYKYSKESDEIIKKEYEPQISLYKKALKKSLNLNSCNIKSFIWNVEKESLIEF